MGKTLYVQNMEAVLLACLHLSHHSDIIAADGQTIVAGEMRRIMRMPIQL